MRVLHVIQRLDVGGAEMIVRDLSSALIDAGHAAAVVASPGVLRLPDRVQTFPLPMLERSPWRVPQAVVAVREAMRAFRPTVVHAHNPGVGLVAGLASLRSRSCPTICTVHGLPLQDYRRAGRVLAAAGVRTVSCGPGVTRALQSAGIPVAAEVINGVRPQPLSTDSALRAVLLDGSSGPLLLTVGRLAPQKNHPLLLRAWARLSTGVVALVGEGPDRDRLEALSTELGIGDRVRWLGRRSDVPDLLAASDGFVLCSHWEGLPLALLEAMSAGRAVVGTSVTGIAELVRHDVDGLLVPDDDVEALAESCRRLLSEPELRARLGAAAGARASEFSSQRMVRDYLSLYARLGG